ILFTADVPNTVQFRPYHFLICCIDSRHQHWVGRDSSGARLNSHGQTRQIQLTRSIGAIWIILDVVFGLIPVVVDAITGNWYEVGPDKVFVDFTAAETPDSE
ncbi:MAG: hypothetical protein AAF297_10470, partial [Planctomycetota bacterium]